MCVYRICSWRNKEIIQDQDKVQSIVKSIVLESVNGSDENNWKATRLDAADVKFKVNIGWWWWDDETCCWHVCIRLSRKALHNSARRYPTCSSTTCKPYQMFWITFYGKTTLQRNHLCNNSLKTMQTPYHPTSFFDPTNKPTRQRERL